jgi:hypothetical protein
MKLRARPRTGESQCPYCHDGFAKEERVVSCGGCATVYHADCLRDELRSCATLGCEVRPELGKIFPWGEHAPRPSSREISCCPEGVNKPGSTILICAGCGSLVHARCRERAGPCCVGVDALPLLGEMPTRASILLPQTKFWLAVLLLLFGGFVVRLLKFNASTFETLYWVLGIGAVVTFGLVMAARAIRQRGYAKQLHLKRLHDDRTDQEA